jgi:hypothetical protein
MEWKTPKYKSERVKENIPFHVQILMWRSKQVVQAMEYEVTFKKNSKILSHFGWMRCEQRQLCYINFKTAMHVGLWSWHSSAPTWPKSSVVVYDIN